MSSVQWGSDGVLCLSGVLDHGTGLRLREQGHALIAQSAAPHIILDCAAVEKSNSVGLALLLAFMRDTQALGKTVTVRAMPSDMQKIAQVCELTDILLAQE